MKSSEECRRENEALRDRVSRLSSAILRISESLDLGTVLREVVDGARALTGARFGGVTTVSDSGQVQEFVTSGITAAEHQRVADWPDGLQIFEHFRDLPGPLRLADLPTYLRSLGHSPDRFPSKTCQCTPLRHRGVHVGHFFLGEKEGGQEFTSEDEEILVLFGAQAATAIANARTYRDEQRARAELEALVDTSPVGVVVFDARTGKPVSLNREGKRIVGGLGQPDRSPEQLLEVITLRRADGREISLEEFLLAQAPSSGETLRAEDKGEGKTS